MKCRVFSNGIVRIALSVLILMVYTNLSTAKPLQTAYAASFTVTKTADTNDGTCDTDCSLREAIIAANANPGEDTINVPAGTYTLSITGTDEDNAATGDLDINDDLNIVGTGAGLTVINGGASDRIIHVTGAYTVNISHLDLVNGYYFVFGGSNGGGVLNTGGDLTLDFTNIKGNTSFSGGGIANLSGTVNILNSTISGNIAVNGGGILNDSGTLTIVNSTVSSNTAEGTGIGIDNASGTVDLNNVTITKNTNTPPYSSGGGIAGDSIYASNSIIAGNTADYNSDCSGTLISQGYNLIQDTTGCTISGDTTGNLTGVDPLLGPLQDNGGETYTHALLSGSPGIDAGNPATPGSGGNACASADQRGVVRPQGPGCDIGSLEVIPVTYSISGNVADINNTPISGVTVSAGIEHTTTSDMNGDYLLTDLLEGIYTLTPSKPGYTFSPITRTVSVPPDATGQDFAFNGTHTIVDPAQDTTLIFTDTLGSPTSVEIPAGAITQTVSLIYTPVISVTEPSGFSFTGHAFELEAYADDSLLSDFTFEQPVTVTLHYADSDVPDMDEATLVLLHYDGSNWVDAACGAYERYPEENWLRVPICHLSKFALFGNEIHLIFLPITIR
jgi:CSLREA domain-containing protein